MSIYDLQSGKKYVCNLCGDERESSGLPEWWTEIKSRRTETLQHLCVSCADDAIAGLIPRLPSRRSAQPCPPPHTS